MEFKVGATKSCRRTCQTPPRLRNEQIMAMKDGARKQLG